MAGFCGYDLISGHSPGTLMVHLDVLYEIAENIAYGRAEQRKNDNNYNCN